MAVADTTIETSENEVKTIESPPLRPVDRSREIDFCSNPSGRAHVRIAQADLVQKIQNEAISRNQSDKAKFYVMFVLTMIMFCIELGFGLWATSLALLADALHMFSDFVALIIGYYSVRVLKSPPTWKSTYGLTRMEVVGALFNGAFMLSSTLFIVLEAINRLALILLGQQKTAELEERSELVLIVGSVGLLFNIIGICVFGHDHAGHSHGHGEHHHGRHSHSDEEVHIHHSDDEHDEIHIHHSEAYEPLLAGDNRDSKKIREIANLNIYGVLLHVIGDALGSVAVVATALIIEYTKWEMRAIVDPICSLLISIILVVGTIPLIRQSVGILLQNSPASIEVETIMDELKSLPGVSSIHEFHIWQLSSKVVVASVHAVIIDGHDAMDVLDSIKEKLHSHGIHSSTIQPEFFCSEAGMSKHCKTGMGSDLCHDPVCGQECLEKICCPIVAHIDEKQIMSITLPT